MIIWIDGPYGIGKTNVAVRIYDKLKKGKIELINSDNYYHKIIKEIAIFGGGTLPQNNKLFLNRFRKIIEEKISDSSKIIIIDMAVTEPECKENLFDYFNNNHSNIFHFILRASLNDIKKRIINDQDRDKENSLYYLDSSMMFLQNNFKNDIWIDTSNKNIDEIADRIIAYIENIK